MKNSTGVGARKRSRRASLIIDNFYPILSQIKDKEITDFVYNCFDLYCPNYFWTVPASLSGKYHPSFDLGKSGLIRHTRTACWWGIELSRFFDVNQDEVLAALLMHDMWSKGQNWKEEDRPIDGIVGEHGCLLADHIIRNYENFESMGAKFDRIVFAIGAHMSRWTPDKDKGYKITIEEYIRNGISSFENVKMHSTALCVQMADYASSRKFDQIADFMHQEFLREEVKI